MLKWLRDSRNLLLINIISPLIVLILGAVFTRYVLEQNLLHFLFVETVTIPSAIITTAGIIILILFLLVVNLWGSNKTLKKSLGDKDVKSEPFLLSRVEDSNLLFEAYINPVFKIEDRPPSYEFSAQIFLSETIRCTECNSRLITIGEAFAELYTCPRDRGHVNEKVITINFDGKSNLSNFQTEVEENYDEYWLIYVDHLLAD